MKIQRCCAHCPGKLVLTGSNESHDCCQPTYVTGNLRVSSLRKQIPGYGRQKERTTMRAVEPISDKVASCYDKFALAKRLHAENLEHHPLPDTVDDSVFKVPKPVKSCRRLPSGKCNCVGHHMEETEDVDKKAHRYGPVLGCKKPETRMDLAICWEAPIDPTYEPRRAAHIDGSEGGCAPAIFALVQHTPESTRAYLRSAPSKLEKAEGSKYCPNCPYRTQEIGTQYQPPNPEAQENGETEDRKQNRNTGCCCECLCKNLKEVKLSKHGRERRSRSERPYRRCAACAQRTGQDDPRLIKSAVGLALGTDKNDGSYEKKRDGLPPKVTVPRPRTPFARRSFCIDTLTPPFSIVKGCRDTDYPEHWRLMSSYQQSYKNPQKRRAMFHS